MLCWVNGRTILVGVEDEEDEDDEEDDPTILNKSSCNDFFSSLLI